MVRLHSLLVRSACGLVFFICLASVTSHVHAIEEGCMIRVSQCFGHELTHLTCAFINDQTECLSVNCSESDSQFLRSETCKMAKFNDVVTAVLNMSSHQCAIRLSANCFDLDMNSPRVSDIHQVSEYLKFTCEVLRSQNVTKCLTENNGEEDPGCTQDEHDRLSGAICELSAASKTNVMTSFAMLASFLVFFLNSTNLQ